MDRSLRPLLVGLFLAALLVRGLTALTLREAGYVDAFYYFHVARNMVEGLGMNESVLWNYLDDPQQLPRPANQYWMPLTTLIAWASMAPLHRLIGAWRAAQLPFILLASLLPPLAAWLCWHEWRRRDWALAAGLLTLFSGFYFSYWVVTDNFTVFAVTVALTMVALWRAQETGHAGAWALAGLGAGLSHLARVDGALLVPLIAGFIGWATLRGPERDLGRFLRWGSAAALGYLLIMAPWWYRNLAVTGTAFPGGGTQTLWMRSYNELFAYDPTLTPQRYLAWGLGPILESKFSSVLTSALIVMGSTQFFMAPVILLALPEATRRPLFRPVLAYTLLLLTAMPLIFTFPATRGSLLHSSAALVPWMMALVPPGVAKAVGWIAARRRRWDAAQATNVFTMGFALVAIVITLYIYAGAVWLEPQGAQPLARWNERTIPFTQIEAWLDSQGVAPDARLFVGDPSGYYVTTRRPALVIPTEGPEMLARAGREWEARWLVLDIDNRGAYLPLYDEQRAVAGWQHVATFHDALGRPVYLFHLQQ